MRILQILPAMQVGGVETGTLDLSRELVRRGHKAYVVSAGGDLVPELIKAGVKHITLPVKKKSLLSLGAVLPLRLLIERERIDIVHARSRVPALLAYWATRGTRATFITTCHGYYSTSPMSRVMGWGRRVIVTSTVIGRRMIDTFGVDPSRIRLVHRGVDLSQFTYEENKYLTPRAPGEKVIVTCIGRISPIKGMDDFIKAIALLARRHPHMEAWIVGEGGRKNSAYVQQLKKLTENLGLQDTVKFLGLRRDISTVLKQTDVLVLPTRVPESFGRVLVEAGASGTVTVATKLGGVLDIIDHEENGLLVPPTAPSEMADALDRLLGDRALSARLSKNLREKVTRLFSLTKMASETLNVYEEALADRRILIVKLGALGDVVLATPTFRMVRKRFPEAHIALLVDRRFQQVVQDCPHLNEIIPLDRETSWRTLSGFLKWTRRVRREGFDISIDLQNTTKSHLLAFLAGIAVRAGYRRGWSGRLLNRSAHRFDDTLPPVKHQYRVLEQVHVREFTDELELWPDAKAETFLHENLEAEWVSDGQKLVGFVLGASKRWVTKQWPIEYFVQLAERLASELGARIVLIGDATDNSLAEEFKRKSTMRPIDLTGRTDLDRLIALIDRLDVLVTLDSAPMHIAAAVKTPLVALFGPTDPRRHAPPGTGHQIFFKQVSCSPCYQTKCFVGHICMHRIPVSDVFEAVKEKLHEKEERAGVHRLTPAAGGV